MLLPGGLPLCLKLLCNRASLLASCSASKGICNGSKFCAGFPAESTSQTHNCRAAHQLARQLWHGRQLGELCL